MERTIVESATSIDTVIVVAEAAFAEIPLSMPLLKALELGPP